MAVRRRILDVVLGALAGAGCFALFARPAAVRGADEPAPANAAANFMMATGASVHGGVLLFLFDASAKRLLVYEAEGGSKGTRGITFVAARKVDRDVFVTGYNDKSEYSYSDLLKRVQQEELRSKSLEDSTDGPPTAPQNPAQSDGDNH